MHTMGTWKKTLVLGLLLPASSTIGFVWLSVIALVHRDIGEAIAAPVLIRLCLVLSPALCAAGLATALLALRKSPRSPTAWTAAVMTAATLILLGCLRQSFFADL